MVVTISGAMRVNKLYPGKEVEVFRQEKEEVCPGRVVGFAGGLLELAIMGECTSIEKGSELSIRFVVPDDAPYIFKGKVYSWQEGRVQLTGLSSLARVEQRGSYRVKTNKPLQLKLGDTGSWLDGTLLDISRTGARLRTDEKALPGQTVSIRLDTDRAGGGFELGAEVVHVIGDGESVQLGVRFVSLPILIQEALVEYVLRLWVEKKKDQEN